MTIGTEPDKAWTDLAGQWPVRFVSRETTEPRQISNFDPATRANFVTEHETLTQLHMICGACDQSVSCLTPGTGESYHLTWDSIWDSTNGWWLPGISSGIVAHIRQCHPGVVAS